jgi:hypothetical protein
MYIIPKKIFKNMEEKIKPFKHYLLVLLDKTWIFSSK